MNRSQLAPSILSFDPDDFRTSVTELMAQGPDWIHLDVMDGQFVPPITFGADLAASLGRLGDVPVEAHLMTMTPERHFEAFARAGCKRITFHVEASADPRQAVEQLVQLGVRPGLAINPPTPADRLFPFLDQIDLALVMTVNPGWGGQRLIEECLQKVSVVREAAPNLDIQVDGGIDAETLPRAMRAGANVFVAGSLLVRAGIPRGMALLREACGSRS